MLVSALVLFGIAALVGIGMLSLRSLDRYPSPAVIAFHGIPAVTALILLAIVVLTGNVGGLDVGAFLPASLIVFVLAALGGAGLLVTHLKKGAFPMSWAVGHGALALVAFLLFIVAVFR